MTKSAMQSLIMVSVVIIALIIFTFAACNAIRGSADNPSGSESTTTNEITVTTKEETTKKPIITYPPKKEETTPKVVTTAKPQQTEATEETTLPETTPPKEPDFRSAFWGDSVEAVKTVESDFLVKESATVLMYRSKILDYSANTVFYFNDDGELYNGTYLFTNNHAKGIYYLQQYNELKNSLIMKYGHFNSEEIKYLKGKELVDAIGEATALEFGYISYLATWKTENSVINLSMMSQNYDIVIIASYTELSVNNPKDPSGL